ncbi:MAG TPA: hypothetical protein VFV31_00685 [Chitinophagaceae bacterium]|nr:hypothetical protein [Chitinophagaceae bacterium]
MDKFDFEGLKKSMHNIQDLANELNMNAPKINSPQITMGQLLNELKNEVVQLQKIQKEKDWVQRHPFWFGTIMAAIGAVFGALATLLVQWITQ